MISSSARSGWDTASLPGGLGGRSAPAWRECGATALDWESMTAAVGWGLRPAATLTRARSAAPGAGRRAGVPHRQAVRMLGHHPGQTVVRRSGMVPRGRRAEVGLHAGDGARQHLDADARRFHVRQPLLGELRGPACHVRGRASAEHDFALAPGGRPLLRQFRDGKVFFKGDVPHRGCLSVHGWAGECSGSLGAPVPAGVTSWRPRCSLSQPSASRTTPTASQPSSLSTAVRAPCPPK